MSPLVAQPVLVGCSHGTDDAAGRVAIASILHDVRALRPGLDVREAFVDVQQPEVADVVADALTGASEVVVVPLLLSVGYHVGVDIVQAVARPGAAAAVPLGPDDRLVAILADRLAQAGLRPDDGVVLAAAGSSVAAAAVAVETVASGLAAHLGRPVTVGYGAGAHPRVPVAVEQVREGLAPGGRVVVASYLLAPGFFHDRVLEAGADVVAAPLAPDVRLARIVLDRYDTATEVLRGGPVSL
ncbi:sirohydrochlorin chelatase [Cellulomonas soli]|uniref:sirohydrochlorin chelatase n=1 Tax=Cellulomonas soli TaxID=931535 RepID=UPI003F82DC41